MSSLDSSAPAPGCLPRPSARWWWPRSSEQKKRRGFCGGWSFGSLNSCKERKERHYINEWEQSVYQACRGKVGRLTWSGRIFRGRWRGRSGTARARWAPNKTDSSPSWRRKNKKQMRSCRPRNDRSSWQSKKTLLKRNHIKKGTLSCTHAHF